MEDLDKAFDKKFDHFNHQYLPRGGNGRQICDASCDKDYTLEDVKSFIHQREKDLQESLEDMVRQFAYEGEYRNKPAYITGGLSSLEYAFRVLGWKDPHPCPENTCEWKGCLEWTHAGTPYKKGYLRCCGEHFKKAQELSNE